MTLARDTLKAAAVALLDSLATEHPLRHQKAKARRYVLRAPGGTPLEIMFDRGENSRANLWVHASAAGPLRSRGELEAASNLWTKVGKDGQPDYGRHSSLEKMPQLGDADLIRFPLTSLEELGRVLDQLWSASASGITI